MTPELTILILPHARRHAQALERDVAYELIPYLQRRNMHAKLAAALEEARFAAIADGSLPVPATAGAHHWQKSCASVEIAEWRRTMKVHMQSLQHGPSMTTDHPMPSQLCHIWLA